MAEDHSQPVLIFGARVFAEEVADLAGDIPGVRVAGFVENLDRNHPRELRGLPVYWIDEVADLAGTHKAVCALGTTRRRAYVERVMEMKFTFVPLIHPTARVSVTTLVGAGTIISAGCLIGAYSRVGDHVIFNRGAMMGHHSEIGDYSTVCPGANLAGLCRIGAQVHIGIGALVVDRLSIGSGSVIAAGSLVHKDVPERAHVAGNPARIVKTGIEPK